MPLDPAKTSSSLSFASDEHLPCLCLSDARVPGVSLSSLTPLVHCFAEPMLFFVKSIYGVLEIQMK